jgi:hypothetical protein
MDLKNAPTVETGKTVLLFINVKFVADSGATREGCFHLMDVAQGPINAPIVTITSL